MIVENPLALAIPVTRRCVYFTRDEKPLLLADDITG
jgi:hypothetical protein